MGSPELVTSSHQVTESADPQPFRSPAPTRVMDKLKITKNRTRNRDLAQKRLHLSTSSSQSGFQQLNEEKLFELLIGRIRKREETEAAIVNVQREVEAHNTQLMEENRDLRHQAKTYYGRFQKSVAELEECKSRIEDWKTKIRKFKNAVDGLGQDYDALRNDNTKIKETAVSLEEEKCNLMRGIDEIKIQISQAEERNEQQQKEIWNHEKSLAVLKQSLSDCELRERTARAQLSDEKRRSSNLELYIQGESKNHNRQLRAIRENQRNLAEELDSGLRKTSKTTTESRDAIVTQMDMTSRTCCSSIDLLAEKIAIETVNTASFTEAAHGVVAE